MTAYTGPLVDADIHHSPRSDSELVPYLPDRWRTYAESSLRAGLRFDPFGSAAALFEEKSGARQDAVDAGAGRGSSAEIMREQLLEPANVTRALCMFNLGAWSHHPNPEFAAALCRAANDWNTDQWLPQDDRFYSGIVASLVNPEAAAEEIHRLAGHPRLIAVFMLGDGLKHPLGDPLYEPIYRAAVETGLPIVTHPADRNRLAGSPGTTLEVFGQLGFRAPADLASLIVHGVFERHPSLRVLMLEFGQTWLTPMMWNLDGSIDVLRIESPWVKRLPSEYLREHVKFSTQPLEADGRDRVLLDILQGLDGVEDLLCYSSDYPHWSMDDFAFVARQLPVEWHEQVFYRNTCDFFGWSPEVIEREARVVVG